MKKSIIALICFVVAIVSTFLAITAIKYAKQVDKENRKIRDRISNFWEHHHYATIR